MLKNGDDGISCLYQVITVYQLNSLLFLLQTKSGHKKFVLALCKRKKVLSSFGTKMNTVLTILSHLGSTTAEWWAKEICCMQMLCWALLSVDAFTVSQFPPKMERIKWRQQQKSYIMHAPCGCRSRLGIWQCLSHVLVRLLFGPCVATADTRAPVWFFWQFNPCMHSFAEDVAGLRRRGKKKNHSVC